MPAVVARNRRLVAANGKWKVYLEGLADGGGNEIHDYMVIEGHNQRSDRITGVVILPIIDAGFVLMRCYRHALRNELWEVPRGFIDEGETPARAALRELAEETGLSCAPDDLLPLGFYAPEPGSLAARGAIFAATRCRGVPRPAADEIGIEAIEIVDAAKMAELASNGEIEDAGTLIAFYRYCALRAQLQAP
jgi:8-oxo-dGTP pyrophosphatase MutT (NUDIX family)